ncbi:MAG TPA: hypothetical protein VGR35_16670 [Tepidisphaeraceae bacterium]|nr:hypothetical protein [Tepidisphaeraceae bacterium]
MGEVFFIVNPAKRQYLDPVAFGDKDYASAFLKGYHALAVARLACNRGVDYFSGGLSWYGDPITFAGDAEERDAIAAAASASNLDDRNLYAIAWQDFTNISSPVIAMLCDYDSVDEEPESLSSRIASVLAARAQSNLVRYRRLCIAQLVQRRTTQ